MIKSFVSVEAVGRISSELMAAAEQFADSVDVSTILDVENASDELMAEFRAATPEFDAPKHSEASDQRSSLCFAVVQR